jgi:hypothetical protein
MGMGFLLKKTPLHGQAEYALHCNPSDQLFATSGGIAARQDQAHTELIWSHRHWRGMQQGPGCRFGGTDKIGIFARLCGQAKNIAALLAKTVPAQWRRVRQPVIPG